MQFRQPEAVAFQAGHAVSITVARSLYSLVTQHVHPVSGRTVQASGEHSLYPKFSLERGPSPTRNGGNAARGRATGHIKGADGPLTGPQGTASAQRFAVHLNPDLIHCINDAITVIYYNPGSIFPLSDCLLPR